MSQQSACSNCNITGLPVYPLLYAVVPKDIAPKLPDNMGGRVIGIDLKSGDQEAAKYDYGLRVARKGYIYLFYENGIWGSNYWEAYTVNGDGCMLLQYNCENPMPPKDKLECTTNSHQVTRTHYLVIQAPEYCDKVWIAYSQHKWSKDTLKEYAEKKATRTLRMQLIEPKIWINTGEKGKHPHALEATRSNLANAMEFQPNDKIWTYTQKEIGLVSKENGSHEPGLFEMQKTMHPFNSRVGTESNVLVQMHATGMKPDKLTAHPPMMVGLWDAIGITHELCGWANLASGLVNQYQTEEHSNAQKIQAMHMLTGLDEILMKAVEGRAIQKSQSTVEPVHPVEVRTHCKKWKLEAEKASEPSKSHYLEAIDLLEMWDQEGDMAGYQRDLIKAVERSIQAGKRRMESSLELEMENLKALVAISPGRKIERNMEIYKKQVSDFKDKREKNYAPLLKEIKSDKGDFQVFKKNYERFLDHSGKVISARVIQLIKWLESPLLIDTLRDYDKKHGGSGLDFLEVIETAIFGMTATKEGQIKLEEWIKELKCSNPENLFWRAFARNQTEIAKKVDELLMLADQYKDKPFTAEEFDKILVSIDVKKGLFDVYSKSEAHRRAVGGGAMALGDRLMLTAGDRFFKVVRLAKMTDSLGEALSRHLLGSKLLLDQQASRDFIVNDAQHRWELHYEAKKAELRAEAIRKRQAFLLANPTATQAQRITALKQIFQDYKTERSAVSSDYQNRLHIGGKSHADFFIEVQAKVKADPRLPMSTLLADARNNPANPNPGASFLKDRRLALFIGMIEIANFAKLAGWDFAVQGKHDDKTTYSALASWMSITAVVADVSAMSAGLALGEDSMKFHRLKAIGGFLACGAGAIGAVFDLQDRDKSIRQGRDDLGWLYGTRAALGGGVAVVGGVSSIGSVAGYMAARIGLSPPGYLVAASAFGTRAAGWLAVRFILCSVGFGIGVIMIGISIAIMILDDDPLEKWLKACIFGPDRFKEDRYQNKEDQEKKFREAIQQVS